MDYFFTLSNYPNAAGAQQRDHSGDKLSPKFFCFSGDYPSTPAAPPLSRLFGLPPVFWAVFVDLGGAPALGAALVCASVDGPGPDTSWTRGDQNTQTPPVRGRQARRGEARRVCGFSVFNVPWIKCRGTRRKTLRGVYLFRGFRQNQRAAEP